MTTKDLCTVLPVDWNRRSNSGELDQVRLQCCNLRYTQMHIQKLWGSRGAAKAEAGDNSGDGMV